MGAIGVVFGVGAMSTSAFASTYTASISTSPIDMNATAAGTGANITTNNVTVISTCPSGYTLGINSSEEDTKLYMGGDSSNGTNNNTNYIDASTGTPANPVVITGSNLNTWGYSTTSSTTSGTFIGLTNNIATLATSAEPTSSTGITIPVYYGVSVDTDRAAGTYQMANNGTIVYTLTTDLSCTSYQVVFNSNGGTGTMDNQWIAEDDSAPLSNNNYTGPSSTPYFAGWNTAADGSGTAYTNQASVTNLTTLGNTITLYAQWTDCPANKICYDNNNDSVTGNVVGTMGNQSATSNTDIELMASNYSLDGYGFAGWSRNPDADASMNNNNEYNYTIYGPNATIVTWNIDTGGIKLYAIWVPLAKDSNNNDLAFQTSSLLTTTLSSDLGGGTLVSKPNGFVTALKDQRDNQVYAVAKLADGNYWMIENLRLDTAGTVGSNVTDPTKTNQSLAQGYGGVFAGLADPETANFSDSTTANSLYYSGTQSGTATINIGADNNPGYRFPRYNNSNTNSRANAPTGSNTDIYSYGDYYTWAAAMANTTNYTTYSGVNGSDAASTSLCPGGWRLPYGRDTGNGNTSGGFYYLGVQLSATTGANGSKVWRSFPNNFLYSGAIRGSEAKYRGSSGSYWSSSVHDVDDVYSMYFHSFDLYPGSPVIHEKHDGLTVRCVAGS